MALAACMHTQHHMVHRSGVSLPLSQLQGQQQNMAGGEYFALLVTLPLQLNLFFGLILV